MKNASHLAAIRSLYLAVIYSSASHALWHSTTLLFRSVKVLWTATPLSIIVTKSNDVKLQHLRAHTTKRKYAWRPTLTRHLPLPAVLSLSSPILVAATNRNYSHHNRIIPDVTLCNNSKLNTVSGPIPLPSRHKTTNQKTDCEEVDCLSYCRIYTHPLPFLVEHPWRSSGLEFSGRGPS